MNRFFQSFELADPDPRIRTNGFFGYSAYDAIKYFEDIKVAEDVESAYAIPDMVYSLYRIIIAINHFQNTLTILENQTDGYDSQLDYIQSMLFNRNFATFPFSPRGKEESNMTDQDYKDMVKKGKAKEEAEAGIDLLTALIDCVDGVKLSIGAHEGLMAVKLQARLNVPRPSSGESQGEK